MTSTPMRNAQKINEITVQTLEAYNCTRFWGTVQGSGEEPETLETYTALTLYVLKQCKVLG
jgi:hypothetical protein